MVGFIFSQSINGIREMHAFMHMYMYMHVYLYVCMYMYSYVWMYLYVYVCILYVLEILIVVGYNSSSQAFFKLCFSLLCFAALTDICTFWWVFWVDFGKWDLSFVLLVCMDLTQTGNERGGAKEKDGNINPPIHL